MADTQNDVTIPAKVWTDLYAASGISVGTAVKVYNKGSGNFTLAIKATAPSDPADEVSAIGIPVAVFPEVLSVVSVEASETGLWAWSENGTIALVQD